MGIYRRKFTREVKLAAIQQLETGSSAAEVARAFEVNPALLHRSRTVSVRATHLEGIVGKAEESAWSSAAQVRGRGWWRSIRAAG